jgi:hypothetical protein
MTELEQRFDTIIGVIEVVDEGLSRAIEVTRTEQPITECSWRIVAVRACERDVAPLTFCLIIPPRNTGRP